MVQMKIISMSNTIQIENLLPLPINMSYVHFIILNITPDHNDNGKNGHKI